MAPMADDNETPSLMEEFLGQLRANTRRMEEFTRLGTRFPLAPGTTALPGAMSAAQLTSITDSIAAQRRSIEALQAQLSAFDEQLAVFERFLGPFAEWSRAWADAEQRWLGMFPGRGPEAGG
jgi:hypothetical protein